MKKYIVYVGITIAVMLVISGVLVAQTTIQWEGVLPNIYTGTSGTESINVTMTNSLVGLESSEETALTNTIHPIADFTHTTSGTPANGIGESIRFTQEVTSGNEIAGQIGIAATDVTAASEDFQYVVHLMAGGSAMAEVYSLSSVGAGAFDSGLTVNEDGDDADTRIESDAVTDAFKVDAGTDRLDFGTWYTLEGSAAVEAASYSVTATSKATYYDVSHTDTAAVGITLDTDLVAYTGLVLGFCDTELNASSNNITIGTEGAETINEANTYAMNADGECVWVRANGTNWHVVNAYLE